MENPVEYHFSFEKLDVWQKARNFVSMVYKHTNTFPKFEQYGLSSQMQRAAVSVPSNIAEGVARKGDKDKLHFLEFAYASLMEVYSQYHLAIDIGYLSPQILQQVAPLVSEIANKINSLSIALNKNNDSTSVQQI